MDDILNEKEYYHEHCDDNFDLLGIHCSNGIATEDRDEILKNDDTVFNVTPLSMVLLSWVSLPFPTLGTSIADGLSLRETCIQRDNKNVTWAIITSQGIGKNCTDAYKIVRNYMKVPCTQFGGCVAPSCADHSGVHYFGMFDGHGYSKVSSYCARSLNKILKDEWCRGYSIYPWHARWQAAFYGAFGKVDDTFRDDALAPYSTGSTALVVLISPCQIVVANCGDAKAVLYRGSETVSLTRDHKLNRDDELRRVIHAGRGYLPFHKSDVKNGLPFTRALAHHALKPWLIPVPDISFITRTTSDEFIIIATDGLWDAVDTKRVVRFVSTKMRERRTHARETHTVAKLVAGDVIEEFSVKYRMHDTTVIIVDLKDPSSKVAS